MTVGIVGSGAVAVPPDATEPAVRSNDPPPKSTATTQSGQNSAAASSGASGAAGTTDAATTAASADAQKQKAQHGDGHSGIGWTETVDGTPRQIRLRIEVDQGSGRYVYLGVDAQTGKVVNQYPPKDVLERIAYMRKTAGQVVDHKT